MRRILRRQAGISMPEMILIIGLIATIAAFSQRQLQKSINTMQARALSQKIQQVRGAVSAFVQSNGQAVTSATGMTAPPAFSAAPYCYGYSSNAGVVITPFNATFDGAATTASSGPVSDSLLYGNTADSGVCIVTPSLLSQLGFLPLGVSNVLPDGNGIVSFIKQYAKTSCTTVGATTTCSVVPSGSLVILTVEVPAYTVDAVNGVITPSLTVGANMQRAGNDQSASDAATVSSMVGAGGATISNSGCPAGTQAAITTADGYQVCGSGWKAPLTAFIPSSLIP